MSNTHKRGFASMPADMQKRIASQGGVAAHVQGRAHQFTSAEASAAGKKGAAARRANGIGHTFNSAEARAAGKKGAAARWAKRLPKS